MQPSDVKLLELWGKRSDGPTNGEILTFAHAVWAEAQQPAKGEAVEDPPAASMRDSRPRMGMMQIGDETIRDLVREAGLDWDDGYALSIIGTRIEGDPNRFVTLVRLAVAEAQQTAARLDMARLDWLSRAGDVSIYMLHDQPGDGQMRCDTDVGCGQGTTLRDAIDAVAYEQGGITTKESGDAAT